MVLALITRIGVFAAEEGEGGSSVDLVLPETAELIAGIIAFGIVFFFVWKWALPAINKTLDERSAAIAGRLDEAEKAKAEAESLLADYRAQLADSKSKGSEIIEEARSQAENLKADIVAKAQAEAEQLVTKAREEAATEKSRMLAETRDEVANLSIDLAEKMVGESLDRKAQLGLVERYLSELEK